MKPFQVTPEMEKELSDEISTLTAENQPSYDSTGSGSDSPSLYRRQINKLSGKGDVQRLQDDTKGLGEEPVRTPPVAADPINPPHYRSHPSGVECIEITRHMNFNIGNAVKYIWRAGQKGDLIEDLKKAQWYLDDEIRRLEREQR